MAKRKKNDSDVDVIDSGEYGTREGDDVETIPDPGLPIYEFARRETAVPPAPDYHSEALAVAGIDPKAADPELVELIANVDGPGPSGRVGVVQAHKILAAIAAADKGK